jgi:Cu-processing system permease protein
MKALLIQAGMEVRIGLRNRWVVATTLLLTALSLSIVLVGGAPAGVTGVSALAVITVSLSSLSIFLVPLIALLLSYDAIVGELEQGTMPLLLSYPITRTGVLLGKYLGHSAILGFAVIIGFGSAALLATLRAEDAFESSEWISFAQLVGSSIILGSIFVALGLMCSVLVTQRGTAGGLAVTFWLFFVLLFDMIVLGALVANEGEGISQSLFNTVLMLNPTDVYRMLNSTGTTGTGLVSGMTSLGAELAPTSVRLWSALSIWILAPLGLAVALFRRRDI